MPSRTRLIIGALCLFYVAARIWRLDDSCLWFDEIFSVHAAEHDWGPLFSFVAKDLIHPPLFYAALKGWIAIGGESVFWLRLLPVVFSALAIFPLVRLCRELKLRTSVILLSLFLLAVNGALIKYTQTVRMYSMLMFISLLSMWLFARYFNRGKSFVPLVIANVLLVYTHYFGWLVIASEVAAILWFQPVKWRRTLVMLAIAGAAFVPWMLTVWRAARSGSSLAQNIAWQPRPGLRELITFVIDLVEPFYFQASNIEPASIYFVSTPMLVICTSAVAWFAMEWRRAEEKHSIYLLLFFVVLPVAVAFAASWLLPHSVWGTRHLIIVLPPAITLIANALLSSTVKTFRFIAVSLVIGLCIAGLAVDLRRHTPQHVWCAWNEVASDIRKIEVATDEPTAVYTFENLVAYHVWFALRDSNRFRVSVIKGVDVRTDDEAYFLPRGFDAVPDVTIADAKDDNVWLAFRTFVPGENQPLVEEFNRAGYETCLTNTSEYGKITVFWVKLRRNTPCR